MRFFRFLVFLAAMAPATAFASETGCHTNADSSVFKSSNPNQYPLLWGMNLNLSSPGAPVITPGTEDSNCNLNVNVQGGSGSSSSTPSYTKPLSTVITETVTASTVTTGGAAQTALASSTSRNGCQILNTSTGTEDIDINSTPVTVIQPGGVYTCNVAANQVTQQTIYILGATTGQGYVVSSW